MRFQHLVSTGIAAALLCLALWSVPAHAGFLNCVQFVRQAGMIELSGNAWSWWPNAKGRYRTSQRPDRGAVFVFQRTKAMPSGHVALVRDVINARTIVVEHANWAPRGGLKGRVSTDLVEDVSPDNDWTRVRVMHRPSRSFGKPYLTSGFIHPKLPPPNKPAPEIVP